jgi:hypothetical protein
MSDIKITLTTIAPHDISDNWPEGSRLFFFNPTSRAIEVRPEHRDEIAHSLARVARKMKRRFLILELRLQGEYFALQMSRAAMVAFRDLLRLCDKAFRYSHSVLPKRGNHAD